MRTKLSLMLWIALLALPLTGCDFATVRAGSDPGMGEKVLFQDDFSDSASGWQTWAKDGSVIAYHEGGLRFIINESQYDYWSRPGKWYEDVRLSVTASLKNGPSDNDFGVICRYQDDSNFYLFLASSDGYAGIVKVTGGSYQVISGPTMEYRTEISQGLATNQVRAECIESSLRFYINDSMVAEASDSEFTSGDIGLVAGTYETAGVDILFDDFLAEQP